MRTVVLVLAVAGCNSSSPSAGGAQSTCVLRAEGAIFDCVAPIAGSYAECGPDGGQGAACQSDPTCASCVGSELGNQTVMCTCVDSGLFEGDASYQPGALWSCASTGYSCQ